MSLNRLTYIDLIIYFINPVLILYYLSIYEMDESHLSQKEEESGDSIERKDGNDAASALSWS